MTDNGYLIWIIAMALMTIVVLTIGTLGAADMLSRKRQEKVPADRNTDPRHFSPALELQRRADPGETGEQTVPRHQHRRPAA